jgi:hypothetical protein
MGVTHNYIPVSGVESGKIIAYGRFHDKQIKREETLKN